MRAAAPSVVAGGGGDPLGGLSPEDLEWLIEKPVDLLLVLSHADAAVKGYMATKDNLKDLLDTLRYCTPGPTQRWPMQPNMFVRVSGARRGTCGCCAGAL